MRDQILLISNNTRLEAALREALAETDLELRVGHDGASGLRQAWELLPGVVVVDADLRGPSGFVVANGLRKNARLAEIPLVLASEKADQAALDQHGHLTTRADAYVPAPGKGSDVAATAQGLLTDEERDARIGRLLRIPASAPFLMGPGLSYLIMLIVAAVVGVLIYVMLD